MGLEQGCKEKSVVAVTLSGEDPAVQCEALTAPHHLQPQDTAGGDGVLRWDSDFLMVTAV